MSGARARLRLLAERDPVRERTGPEGTWRRFPAARDAKGLEGGGAAGRAWQAAGSARLELAPLDVPGGGATRQVLVAGRQ